MAAIRAERQRRAVEALEPERPRARPGASQSPAPIAIRPAASPSAGEPLEIRTAGAGLAVTLRAVTVAPRTAPVACSAALAAGAASASAPPGAAPSEAPAGRGRRSARDDRRARRVGAGREARPRRARAAEAPERRRAARRRRGTPRDREGVVSLAIVNSDGRLRGYRENRRYASASVVKAMLLAAEMRRLKHAGERLDSSTDALLTAMITVSDNDAADTIYARVGDAGPVRGRQARRDDPVHGRRPLGQRADRRGRHGALLRRPRPAVPAPLPRVREGAARAR